MAVMEREAVTYHVEEAMKVALTVGAQRTDTDVLQIQNKTLQRNILMHEKVWHYRTILLGTLQL